MFIWGDISIIDWYNLPPHSSFNCTFVSDFGFLYRSRAIYELLIACYFFIVSEAKTSISLSSSALQDSSICCYSYDFLGVSSSGACCFTWGGGNGLCANSFWTFSLWARIFSNLSRSAYFSSWRFSVLVYDSYYGLFYSFSYFSFLEIIGLPNSSYS